MEHDLECPYCRNKANLHLDSSIVYGKNYGAIYLCECYPICNSYVGCHPNSTQPLGRLADSNLRYWKKQAHKYFDVLWKTGEINKIYPEFIKGATNRSKAYKWLSKQLNIPGERTHIGMFDVNKCKTVVKLCKPYSNE